MSSSIALSISYGEVKKTSSSLDLSSIPPLLLRTEEGKDYKISIDIIHHTSHATGESVTAVNYQAPGQIISLKKGGDHYQLRKSIWRH